MVQAAVAGRSERACERVQGGTPTDDLMTVTDDLMTGRGGEEGHHVPARAAGQVGCYTPRLGRTLARWNTQRGDDRHVRCARLPIDVICGYDRRNNCHGSKRCNTIAPEAGSQSTSSVTLCYVCYACYACYVF